LNSLTSLDLYGAPLTTFIGGDMDLTDLHFPNWNITTLTSIDLSGMSNLVYLNVSNNQLASFSIGGLTNLVGVVSTMNPLSRLANDQLIRQFNLLSTSYGYFYTSGGRSELSNADFAELESRGWSLSGLDLPPVSAYIVTDKAIGDNVNIGVYTTNGHWKYTHNGVDSEIFGQGHAPHTVSNSNGQFTITPCSYDGTPSGFITYLDAQNNEITSFVGNGLIQLNYLNLTNNKLTTFDGTGLPSVTTLALQGNGPTMTTFIGGDMSQITQLDFAMPYYYGGNLTSFDGSGMTSLNYLNLSGHRLTTFIGEGMTNLGELFLSGNKLTTFSVPEMPNLFRLDLNYNKISSFNVTGLNNIQYLSLGSNRLTSLDCSGMPNLYMLDLQSNSLTSFDGTGLANLYYLNLGSNPLTTFIGGDLNFPSLNFPNWNIYSLTSLDVSGMSNLNTLTVYNNKLTSFAPTDLSGLTTLELNGNQLVSFDGSGMPGLYTLRLSYNKLTTFDGTGLSSLYQLYADGNKLTSFDATGMTSLDYLSLNNNLLTEFNGVSSLIYVYLENNKITTFDGTGLSEVATLQLANNRLSSFNVGDLSSCQILQLNDNLLTTFDGTGLDSITQLYLWNNLLTSFEGDGMPNLSHLRIDGNNLPSFDGSSLTNIYSLELGNQETPFSEIILPPNVANLSLNSMPEIKTLDGFAIPASVLYLWIQNSGLTSLSDVDFDSISSLRQLGLRNNQITLFDGTGLSELTSVDLFGNPITSFITGDMKVQQLRFNDWWKITTVTQFEGSGNTYLWDLELDNNNLSSLNISGLSNLGKLSLRNCGLTSLMVDQYLQDLYDNGKTGGEFRATINEPFLAGQRTPASNQAYDGLLGRGWNLWSYGDNQLMELVQARLKMQSTPYGENPGLQYFDWKYVETTPELDFLDDSTALPLRSWWESRTSFPRADGSMSSDWEDLSGAFRNNRYTKSTKLREYFTSLVRRVPLNITRGYSNIVMDYWNSEWDQPHPEKAHKAVRFQFPSVDSLPNFPDLAIPESYGQSHPFYNSSTPQKTVSLDIVKSVNLRDLYDSWSLHESWDVDVKYLPEDSLFNAGTNLAEAFGMNRDRLARLYMDKHYELAAGSTFDPSLEEEILLRRQHAENMCDLYGTRGSIYDGIDDYSNNYFLNYNGTVTIPNIANDAMPVDVFGPIAPDLNILPAVSSPVKLSGLVGNPGEIIFDYQNKGYAWDPINEEWSSDFYVRYFSIIIDRIYNFTWQIRYTDDFVLGLRPFTFANHHMPAMHMFNDIRNESSKIVPDYNQYKAGIIARFNEGNF
jgi:Leucine-rich repeat (LRR) protein